MPTERPFRIVRCAMCATRRPRMDMARAVRDVATAYYCHPSDATATTCYQLFVMFGEGGKP